MEGQKEKENRDYRKKDKSLLRSTRVEIRFNECELEPLKAVVEQENITISEYIRRLVKADTNKKLLSKIGLKSGSDD